MTVDEPLELTVDLVSITDVLCNGDANGRVSVTVGGGTLPYSYVWSGAASGSSQDAPDLPAGTYGVTVTDGNGCTAVLDGMTVDEPLELTVDLVSITDVLCNGDANGRVSVTVGDGTLPYSYVWSGAASGSSQDAPDLPAGTYGVTVTDGNGCTAVLDGMTVDEPLELTVDLVSITDVLCNGDANGRVSVTVGGGTLPYSYVWSGAASGSSQDAPDLPAGTYGVTVTDGNGCTAVLDGMTVDEPLELTVDLVSITDVLCNGDANGRVSVTVGGGNASVQLCVEWSSVGFIAGCAGFTGGNIRSDGNGW